MNMAPATTVLQSTPESIRLPDDYWGQTRRPLVALAFVLPLLAMYELGVLWLGPQAMRNGADIWLRQLLDTIGFGQYFLLPILTVSILLAWHHTTQQPWRMTPSVLYGMLTECVVLACALIVIAQIHGACVQAILTPQSRLPLTAAIGDTSWSVFSLIVGYSGAGIYEEVMFRLALMPLAVLGFRWTGLSATYSTVAAVIGTSLLFSGAHYIGDLGQAFDFYTFGFRFFAGVFFSVLFVYRGFGIAAGTHAVYDIFVGVF